MTLVVRIEISLSITETLSLENYIPFMTFFKLWLNSLLYRLHNDAVEAVLILLLCLLPSIVPTARAILISATSFAISATKN